MITTLPISIPQRLGQLRTDRDIPCRIPAAAIGVRLDTVYGWEAGLHSPSVTDVTAYAAFLHHRIVVVRAERTVCDLLNALPRLGELRAAAGLTGFALSRRLCLTTCGASLLEYRARAWRPGSGRGPTLASVQRYLEVAGYEVLVIPAQTAVAGEAAA
ncbi:hypothetical protein AB0395_45685 [Streptosporangium sp. NPDC051023]|uniref:hypothetical protein n=1 Tax=Streptosporangium sp. NPDC051023 TaxID=3155410 RepID=UPI00344B2972